MPRVISDSRDDKGAWFCVSSFRRAGKPGSTAGKDADRYGRGVTALAKDLKSAQAGAYADVEKIRFDGAKFRREIAAKVMGQAKAGGRNTNAPK